VRKRIEDLASELPAGEQATPKGLAAFTASEMARLTDAIKKGGVKAQ